MSMSGEMIHLSALPRCGEKKAMVLSPVGASTAGSVGSIGGVVFQGLKTMGARGWGLAAVPEPGKVTTLEMSPKAMG